MNPGFFKQSVTFAEKCGVACTLDRDCRSPKMPVTGEGRMRILIIAEAPGEQEDRQNTQFIGPAGQLLRKILAEHGVDLDRDCRKTNAVRCRPPENRRPTRQEIEACQQHVWDEIARSRPILTLLLGQIAVESFLLGRITKIGQIGRWRGMAIPDQKAGCWICPTFHPSYILRSQEGRIIRGKAKPILPTEELIFRMDLEQALTLLDKPFPVAPPPQVMCEWHWSTKPGDTVAIDYETTGLKPYRKGHRIVSAGISNGEWAWAGEMTPKFARKWKLLLADQNIKKIAHNMKFEHQWAAHCLDVETQGWLWDTMLASHMVDNRKLYCKLKHQAYINFGVPDWSDGIDFENDDDDFAIHPTVVTDKLLSYNALDAFWCYKLYEKQMEKFKK